MLPCTTMRRRGESPPAHPRAFAAPISASRECGRLTNMRAGRSRRGARAAHDAAFPGSDGLYFRIFDGIGDGLAGASRLRPSGRRLCECAGPRRRSGDLRRPLRARQPLPGLELLLSANRGREAVCWLKSEVTPPKEDGCCISGVRGAGVIEPRTGALEFAIDRYGGDYRNFEIRVRSDRQILRIGLRGRQPLPRFHLCAAGLRLAGGARCFLKDKITRPRRKPCCISGVVR